MQGLVQIAKILNQRCQKLQQKHRDLQPSPSTPPPLSRHSLEFQLLAVPCDGDLRVELEEFPGSEKEDRDRRGIWRESSPENVVMKLQNDLKNKDDRLKAVTRDFMQVL